MSDFFGKSVRLSLFGESHSLGIGFVLTNLPPGLPIDRVYIAEALCRRRGPLSVSTPRRERDEYVFLSGIRKDSETGEIRASGTPLAVLIWNKDVDSGPYEEVKDIPRPSHADYTGSIRYRGYHDYRGGGAFSGRLTCPLVFAGSIVRKVLEDKGVIIGSHLAQVGPLEDGRFADSENLEDAVRRVGKSDFPLIREDLRSDFFALLSRAKEDKDSLGGRLETVVVGLKPGYGSLFFDKLDARLAHAVLTIPGIKGISFGSGFQLAAIFHSIQQFFLIHSDTIIADSNAAVGWVYRKSQHNVPGLCTDAVVHNIRNRCLKGISHRTHGIHQDIRSRLVRFQFCHESSSSFC